MKIVTTSYAKELNDLSQKQYGEMVSLIEQTQELISRIEGKNGEPVITIKTKSKNFTLTISHNG